MEGQQPLIELKDIYKIYRMGAEEVHANDGITLTTVSYTHLCRDRDAGRGTHRSE